MNLSNEAINLLRQNARSVVRELGLLNDAYFDIGVTLAERHLLIELSSTPYPTVGEIAERLLLDKSTASRLISKAVKKGYVTYSSDENDKRKRLLQFTEMGRKVLNAFEPIAFNQTKEALLTLTEEEVKSVYQGIELYAKGLKNSRLRSKVAIEKMTQQDHVGLAHLLSVNHKNDNSFGILERKSGIVWDNLFETYQKKGFSYFVMKMESKIIGGAGISFYPSKENHTCKLERICVQTDMRNLGFEKILIEFCVKEAKRLGYDQCCVDIAKEVLFSREFFQELGFQFIKKNQQKALLLWKVC
jgi:putative acetyltransferase